MNTRRPPIVVYALFALLLWGQSATAQHDVEHLVHDSIEVCEVFKHAEKSDGFLVANPQLVASQHSYQTSESIDDFIPSSALFYCGARGPPATN